MRYKEQEHGKFLELMFGSVERRNTLVKYLDELCESKAALRVVSINKTGEQVDFARKRDVASDTDSYNISKKELLDEELLGYMIPFYYEESHALILIDNSNLNASVHFVDKTSEKFFKDHMWPRIDGQDRYNVYPSNKPFHNGRIDIYSEDHQRKILPTSQQNNKEIGKYLEMALGQVKEKIAETRLATEENAKMTAEILENFFNDLSNAKKKQPKE